MKTSFKNILWEHFIFLNAVSWKYSDFPNVVISDFPLSCPPLAGSGWDFRPWLLLCRVARAVSPPCMTRWEASQQRDVKCQLRERRFAGNPSHVALAHPTHNEIQAAASTVSVQCPHVSWFILFACFLSPQRPPQNHFKSDLQVHVYVRSCSLLPR